MAGLFDNLLIRLLRLINSKWGGNSPVISLKLNHSQQKNCWHRFGYYVIEAKDI